MFRVIETRVEVWGNENAMEHEPLGERFDSFFEFSQTFTSVSFKQLDYELEFFIA